jgi:hypothetical protein
VRRLAVAGGVFGLLVVIIVLVVGYGVLFLFVVVVLLEVFVVHVFFVGDVRVFDLFVEIGFVNGVGVLRFIVCHVLYLGKEKLGFGYYDRRVRGETGTSGIRHASSPSTHRRIGPYG